jgi:hypothetical protein
MHVPKSGTAIHLSINSATPDHNPAWCHCRRKSQPLQTTGYQLYVLVRKSKILIDSVRGAGANDSFVEMKLTNDQKVQVFCAAFQAIAPSQNSMKNAAVNARKLALEAIQEI